MSEKEQFNIIFCSRGNNVINNTNLNNVTYNVCWSAILPKKYKKFLAQFVFKSENSTTLLTNNGFVSINLGRVNVYDGRSQTTNLGIIYPVVLSGTNSFYNSTNNDNNQFWMDYPVNETVTVTLNQFDGKTAMSNMPHYAIYLNLIAIAADNDPTLTIANTFLSENF